MPTIQATQSVGVEDFGVNVPFDGLVVLRIDGDCGVTPGCAGDSFNFVGLGSELNLVISVDNGEVVAAHFADLDSIVYEVEMPAFLEPSSSGARYFAGWVGGDARQLRADLGVCGVIERATRTLISVPDVASIEVAGLFGYRV